MQSKMDEKVDELKSIIDEIGMEVATSYTLADAIREGCQVSEQIGNWGNGAEACALTAAVIAAKARGYA